MLSFGAEMRFGSFNQMIQSALWHVWLHSALSSSHGDAEADPPPLHLTSVLNTLTTGICIDHSLLTVQKISAWSEVMHIGSRSLH